MIPRFSNFFRLAAGFGVAAVAALALSACGGDDKPAFCADRSSFEDSVNQLPTMLKDGNVSGLRTQIKSVESEAGTLADSARADYPQETEAIESSLKTLRSQIDDLPDNPKPAELVGVGFEAATAASAVKNFIEATRSDCE